MENVGSYSVRRETLIIGQILRSAQCLLHHASQTSKLNSDFQELIEPDELHIQKRTFSQNQSFLQNQKIQISAN